MHSFLGKKTNLQVYQITKDLDNFLKPTACPKAFGVKSCPKLNWNWNYQNISLLFNDIFAFMVSSLGSGMRL